MKIKTNSLVYQFAIIVVGLLLVISCKKEKEDEKNENTNINQNPNAYVPVVTTNDVYNVTTATAMCSGYVTSDGGATVTARGICYSTAHAPTIADSKTTDGTGTGSFSSTITGLNPNSTYYVRAYATNSAGTSYGYEKFFKTYTGTLTDIEGNIYNTVTIGNQIWTDKNLKTTKYKNGTAIPLVTNSGTWSNMTTPAYCWYDNDQNSNINPYGALYNWYAVNTGNLCPTGWHVPTSDEWDSLFSYIGDPLIIGGKLKEIGTAHWYSPNTGATNEFNFTALPGGKRDHNGTFKNIQSEGNWWSATDFYITAATGYSMVYNFSDIYGSGSNKEVGLSIRCLKD